MKCIICGHEQTVQALTREFLSCGKKGVVIRNVPSQICPNCGEVYHDEAITRRLLEVAELAISRSASEVAVAEFQAA